MNDTNNPWVASDWQTTSFCPVWADSRQRLIVELFEELDLPTKDLPFQPMKHLSIDIHEWKHEVTGTTWYQATCRDTGRAVEGVFDDEEAFYKAKHQMVLDIELFLQREAQEVEPTNTQKS